MLKTLERADIESINFGGFDSPVIEVRGYQNYDLTADTITAVANPTKSRPWTDTKIKAEFFQLILDTVKPRTYADFGSNLGYYIIHAAMQGIGSTGIDYNKEYTYMCQCITSRLDIEKTTWFNSNLQQWSRSASRYDLITVFNVIHHLYNRTEEYKDMDKLIADFRAKGTVVLFEFPTERDKKGYKWTMDTDYTQQLFEEMIEKHFSKWAVMPGQTTERPYYLCYA